MTAIAPIHQAERLAYIDFIYTKRDLAFDITFHYLVLEEALSPVLQAVTLDKIFSYSLRMRAMQKWIGAEVTGMTLREIGRCLGAGIDCCSSSRLRQRRR